MASQQTRAPTSDEAGTGTFNPATNRYAVVDDYPDTTPNDTLTFGTAQSYCTFGFTAFSVPAGSAIIDVQVQYYDDEASNGSNNLGGRLKIGGSYYNASTHNPSTTQTSRTDTWTTNPATSQPWTVDEVNAIQAFGIWSTDSNPTFFITSIQLVVNYNDPIQPDDDIGVSEYVSVSVSSPIVNLDTNQNDLQGVSESVSMLIPAMNSENIDSCGISENVNVSMPIKIVIEAA